MDFHVGQKVIIDSDDTEYLEDRAVDNGMVGVVIHIYEGRRFPIKIKVDSHIAPVECCFKPDELKPAPDCAKII